MTMTMEESGTDVAMTNEEVKSLFIALRDCELAGDVQRLLERHGLWDNDEYWRPLGDNDNNWGNVNNQHERSDAAIVEKLTNSQDAVLLGACLSAGVDPEGDAAPASVAEAVQSFFGSESPSDRAQHWAVAVSGSRGTRGLSRPCISISDVGEGQTPTSMHKTILSIGGGNKRRKRCQQGKFNQGGTASIVFSQDGINLICSKRDPGVLEQNPEPCDRAGHWSFTITRIRWWPDAIGESRTPTVQYLSPGPVGEDGNRGLLAFTSEHLAIMPVDDAAHMREVGHGTLIRMYEYEMDGFASNAVLRGGVMRRLEALQPGMPLEGRVHECRYGPGNATRLRGAVMKMRNSDELIDGFPVSINLEILGNEIQTDVYAFNPERASTYRTKGQAIVFTVHGQSHAQLGVSFIKKARQGIIANDLFIEVDCSNLQQQVGSTLFKASRDRFADTTFKRLLLDELRDAIESNEALSELSAEVRRRDLQTRLSDDRPVQDLVRKFLSTDPSLRSLLLQNQGRISDPVPRDTSDGETSWQAQTHPTIFHFEKMEPGETLVRTAAVGKYCRVNFKTDVVADYFRRDDCPGKKQVTIVSSKHRDVDLISKVNVHQGYAYWSIKFGEEEFAPDDRVKIRFEVIDDVYDQTFVNEMDLVLTAASPARPTQPRDGTRRTRANEEGGNNNTAHLGLPNAIEVYEDHWGQHDFTNKSVIRVDQYMAEGEECLSFYINMDNIFLKNRIARGGRDADLTKLVWKNANVIVGMAAMHYHKEQSREDPIDEYAEGISEALGMFLLPLIDFMADQEATPQG
jgi:hypothetical protein